MSKPRFLILVFIVIGIAGFTSWLSNVLDDEKLGRKVLPEHEADYFLEGFTATSIDKTGRPSYRLEANQLKHYPVNRVVTLEKPYIEFYTAAPQPWQTWAKKGSLYEKNQQMELVGEVRIHRAGNKHEPAITLHTDSLYINTKSKVAETKAEVTINRGKDVISATGMRIDMLNDKLELLSSVEGKYEVPQR